MSQTEPETTRVWRQLAVVIDGQDTPVGRATLMTVTPEGYTVTVNGKVYQRGTARTVADQTPQQSDILVAEGPGAGQTLRQIFRVEGDVLVACAGQPEGPRPTEFASTPGSGQTLSVWLRVPTDVARQTATVAPWQYWILGFLALVIANTTGDLIKDLEPTVGHWGSVVVMGVVGAVLVTVIGLLLKWGWRAAATIGVSMSVAVHTFEEFRQAVVPSVGNLGAIVVGVSTALVIGLAASALTARLLKPRWWW